eukprot:m.93047 g.93047  ORF g.93047 m.93047 type:complete len:190 (-) comp15357_c0_seq1:1014-1583(-)
MEQVREASVRILDLLNATELVVYQNNTTNYGSSYFPGGGSAAPGGGAGRGGPRSYGEASGYGGGSAQHSYGADAYGPYAGQPGAPQPGAPAYGAPDPYGAQPGYAGREEVLTISVPDELVGAIVGKGGVTILELQRQSGARIQISSKGEYVPNTTDRIVTITGPRSATQQAHYLVSRRVQQAQSQPKRT